VTEPLWRPARFFAGILISGDPVFSYTVEAGELAVITNVQGTYTGNGVDFEDLQVTAGGIAFVNQIVEFAQTLTLQPTFNLWVPVDPGDFITVSLGPDVRPDVQASLHVTGRCYSAYTFTHT
jgi:hypothetical protein